MNKVMVGCPSRNDLSCLQLMINSLFNSTRCIDKLVIIDGNSTDGSKEYCDYLAKIDNRIEVYHLNTKTPLEAYNHLFDMAKERKMDLLLTQTDVIFPKCFNRDWLEEMIKIAQIEQVGAVTCLNGMGISGPDYIDGFNWLGGHCSYYPLRTLEQIGGFDKDFPNGYGVDIDHTYRISKSGLQIVRTNYWTDHHMGNSREHDKDEKTEQMKRDSSLFFKKKWGLN